MRTLKYSTAFIRDLKRLQRSADRQTLLDVDAAITLLANDEPVPERLKENHPA